MQRERLEALRPAGNEPLAGGQLGYSEGPSAQPIREFGSLNGIWILHPQSISDNYVVRRGDRECVFVFYERSLGCVLMGCVCVCVCVFISSPMSM